MMEKKLAVEELVKALRCCVKSYGSCEVMCPEECPAYDMKYDAFECLTDIITQSADALEFLMLLGSN